MFFSNMIWKHEGYKNIWGILKMRISKEFFKSFYLITIDAREKIYRSLKQCIKAPPKICIFTKKG